MLLAFLYIHTPPRGHMFLLWVWRRAAVMGIRDPSSQGVTRDVQNAIWPAIFEYVSVYFISNVKYTLFKQNWI